VVATPLKVPESSNTQSGPSSTSEGKKKRQKASAHERNPPKEYGHFVRDTVLEFYNKKTLGTLERVYIDHRVDGLMSFMYVRWAWS
jgi:hypothetical protein